MMIGLTSQKLGRLFDDWDRLREGAPYLVRSNFDPREFKYILGQLALIEIHREPLRFFYRLHGSMMAERLGEDMTGKFIDAAPNKEWAALATKYFVGVATLGTPAYGRHPYERTGDETWSVERLVLPVSSDGVKLDMLISAYDRLRDDDSAGSRASRWVKAYPPS